MFEEIKSFNLKPHIGDIMKSAKVRLPEKLGEIISFIALIFIRTIVLTYLLKRLNTKQKRGE